MPSLSIHRVVPGFNSREQEAVEWIYVNYQSNVFTVVQKLTNDSPDTRDLVSDIFLRLLQHNGQFTTIRKIESFLYTTARNISMDYMRHQQVVKDKSAEVGDHYLALEEHAVQSAELSAAFITLIKLAVDKLPLQCKRVFLLCFTEQLKNAQIAKRLGISEKTVANQKIYAYKKLRMEIDQSKGSIMPDLLGMILF